MSQIVIHGFGTSVANHIRFGLGAGPVTDADTFVPGSGGGAGGHWPPGEKTKQAKDSTKHKKERPVSWTLRNSRVSLKFVVRSGPMERIEPGIELEHTESVSLSFTAAANQSTLVDHVANEAEARLILLTLGLQ